MRWVLFSTQVTVSCCYWRTSYVLMNVFICCCGGWDQQYREITATSLPPLTIISERNVNIVLLGL